MIRITGALGLLLAVVSAAGAQQGEADGLRDRATPGERNGWFAPSTPAAMGEYLAGLAESSDLVSVDTLAWVEGGSIQPDSALPILLAVLLPDSGALK